MTFKSNKHTKLNTAEMSSFLCQTSYFQPSRPRQWPRIIFSKITVRVKWSQRTKQYKLQYGEVRGEVLRPPHVTKLNSNKGKLIPKFMSLETYEVIIQKLDLTAAISCSLGQTSQFRPVRVCQGPLYAFQNI